MVAPPGLRSDAWLRAAWEAASDALALSDPEGRGLAANPAYYRLYGYGPDEVVGKSFAIIFPEEAAPQPRRSTARSSTAPSIPPRTRPWCAGATAASARSPRA